MDRKIKNFPWHKYLKECLESTFYCCLATVDQRGVWSNPVYFAYDKNIIYFISQPDSRHMRNIKRDSRVALSIYTTEQDSFGDIVGIQLDGHARILINKDEVKRAYGVYYNRKYPKTGKDKSGNEEDVYINNPEWQFVRIAPAHIYYFDTRFFGEERQEVPKNLS